MIQALYFAFDLKSSRSMAASLIQSCRLLSPAWSGRLVEMLQSVQQLAPDIGTLSRHRLFLDVAYMQWWR
jgi:hypothetical protein